MTRYLRYTQQVFGASAGNRELTAFGTAKTDNPTYTSDPSQIQTNAYKYGWSPALLSDKAPYEEDTNALFYLFTYQLAYLMQVGIAEYDPNTTYFRGNTVAATDGSGTWYKSIIDNNLGNALTNTEAWQPIILSKQGMPLFTKTIQDHVLQGEDAIGWALQGSLVQAAIYSKAYEKLYNQYNQGTASNYRGISCVRTPDGRYVTPLTNKTAVDNLFSSTGIAEIYIIDTSNSSFYLPRNAKYLKFGLDTSTVNQFNQEGLPSPQISVSGSTTSAGDHNHIFSGATATGSAYCLAKSSSACSGVFSNSKVVGPEGSGDASSGQDYKMNFSMTPSGSISSNGSHTHSLNVTASTGNAAYGRYNTVETASSINLLYYLVGETAV